MLFTRPGYAVLEFPDLSFKTVSKGSVVKKYNLSLYFFVLQHIFMCNYSVDSLLIKRNLCKRKIYYAGLNIFSPINGCCFKRIPVALKIALATAPPVGGKAGSPNPVGSIPLSIK